ncbi:hypothetical protein [Campylobacter concisus]|jgi:hypothetical protein
MPQEDKYKKVGDVDLQTEAETGASIFYRNNTQVAVDSMSSKDNKNNKDDKKE